MDSLVRGLNIVVNNGSYKIPTLILTNTLVYGLELLTVWSMAEYLSTSYTFDTSTVFSIIYYLAKVMLLMVIDFLTMYKVEAKTLEMVRRLFRSIVDRITRWKSGHNKKMKMDKVYESVDFLDHTLTQVIVRVPRLVTSTIVGLYILLSYSYIDTAYILPIAGVMVYGINAFSKYSVNLSKQTNASKMETKKRLVEVIMYDDHIKLNNKQKDECQRVINTYNQYNRDRFTDINLECLRSIVTEFSKSFLRLGMFATGCWYVSNGHSPTEVVVVIGYTELLLGSLVEMEKILVTCIKSIPSLETIYDILVSQDVETSVVDQEDDYVDVGGILFQNVNFRYEPDKPLFEELDLHFRQNQINLLLGQNGSGKSTIIALLLGLVDLEKMKGGNKIYFWGRSIRTMHKDELREQISYVSKEPTIFDDTVWNNITYGVETVDREYVLEMAKMLNCRGWVELNAKTRTGYKGAKLTAGQKKQIQLLNAIIKPTKLIVFDEPSNSLDSVAIKWFTDFIHKLNKTVIIATHDRRLIKSADNTINLNQLTRTEV